MEPTSKRVVATLAAGAIFFSSFLLPINLLGAESSAPLKKVLLVHSYHPEYPWVASITNGIKKAFEGKPVELEIFYMDTKRKTSDEWKAEMGRRAREKIESWHPEVVITADDNAQIFVAQDYLNKTPFFVFCGVNANPADYGFPASNVTGIIERPFLKESVDYLKEILGKKKRLKDIAILSDNCPTSVGALIAMRQEKINEKIAGFHLIENYSTWQTRIQEYDQAVDALALYMYHTLKAGNIALSMDPTAVMAWTIQNLNIPTIGFFDFAIRDGILCGVVESGEEYGYQAGQMALALMNGTDIKQLPIIRTAKGRKMINLKTAEKLGLQIPQEIITQADEVIRS